jgi:hypothetical protein
MAALISTYAVGREGLATGEVTRRLGGGAYEVRLGEQALRARWGGAGAISPGATVVLARTGEGAIIMATDQAKSREIREVIIHG